MSKCHAGQIQRVGYTYTRQKNNTPVVVSPLCITNKGPKLIPMPESG
jgi:hypothetical protein